jgi:DNA-binding beta-propeller fold protein YncE
MSISTERTEEATDPVKKEGQEDDRSTRRLLAILLWMLGIAALALLALLIWLLWPESKPTPGAEAGYPIQVVTTIYGYGDGVDELLAKPLGVTFDADGNVWISDSGQARVEEYTSDGGFIRSVGEQDPGKLFSPYGLIVDQARDRVYVADVGNRLVQVYIASTGAYAGHFPADDQDLTIFGKGGFTPYDVEIANGRIVVTTDNGLYFFDDAGHVVGHWGATYKKQSVSGGQLGAFNFVDAVDVDPKTGRIYVTDTMNRRVVALGSQGRWLWSSGGRDVNGEIVSFWMLPRGVAVGPDGNIYVVDTFRADSQGMGTGHLVVLSPDGKLLSEFGRTGSEDGSFRFPEQLAAGPDGLWAIADRDNDRVVIFRLLTPYPNVKDLLEERYPKGFTDLSEAIITSTPTPEPTP